MAENVPEIVSSHNLSSGFKYDLSCDLCTTKGIKSEMYGCCDNCTDFLCQSCNGVHKHLAVAARHTLVRGSDMPKSQADKPLRYKSCSVNDKAHADRFCSEHRMMICSTCCEKFHKTCELIDLDILCNGLTTSEIDEFTGEITDFKMKLVLTKSEVETTLFDLKEQREAILNQIKYLKDQVLTKIDKEFQDAVLSVDSLFQKYFDEMQSQKGKLTLLIGTVENAVVDVNTLNKNVINSRTYLALQDIVDHVNQTGCDYNTLLDSLRKQSVTLTPCSSCQDFISSPFKFGCIEESHINYNSAVPVSKMTFPVSEPVLFSRNQLQLQSARKKMCSNVKLDSDVDDCWVTGIAITKQGRRLMVDFNNKKVKLFTKDMNFLSSVTFSEWPWNIAVVSNDAIVSTGSKMIWVFDVSGTRISLKNTIQIPYFVKDFEAYKDKLLVINQFSTPVSVRMIDTSGATYWTTSLNMQTVSQNFTPTSVRDLPFLLVLDREKQLLYLLNADTGDIIKSRTMVGKGPHAVTTDTKGNIFITCTKTNEILLMKYNLAETKVLLSCRGLLQRTNCLSEDKPYAVAYDGTCRQIIISYANRNIVDCFQLVSGRSGSVQISN